MQRAGLLIRVSSDAQARKSEGSIGFQKSQVMQVRKHGGDPDTVQVFDALGQSGKEGKARPDIQALRDAISSGSVRCLILAWESRIGRSLQGPISDLLEDLRNVHGSVIARGKYYDLTDHDDLHRLRQQILDAQHQNAQRTFETSVGILTQGKRMAFAIPLPTGLVYASPKDLAFVEAMEREGLRNCLSPDELKRHLTSIEKDDTPRYIFPDPRESCHRAVKFLGMRLLEHESIAGALESILSADPSEYPRPGQLPSVDHSHYREQRSTKRNANRKRTRKERPIVSWTPIKGREDGRDEWASGRVRYLMGSPTLFGIYSYEYHSFQGKEELFPDARVDVWEVGAFPGLFEPEEYNRIQDILHNPARRHVRVGCSLREHTQVVRRLVCGNPLRNGKRCGLALSPVHPTGCQPRYYNAACGARGHATTAPSSVDDTIAEIIGERLESGRVLADLTVELGSSRELEQQVARVNASVAELEAYRKYAKRMASAAERRGDMTTESDWLKEDKEAGSELEALKAELRRVDRQMTAVEPLKAEERQRVLDLATSFPELLGRARKHDGLAHQLTAPLIEEVEARHLGMGIHWLAARFAGGDVVERLSVGVTPCSTPSVSALSGFSLKEVLDPAFRASFHGNEAALQAARELAEHWNRLGIERIGGRPAKEWTEDRVLGAAYASWSTNASALGPAVGRSIKELARHLRVTEDEVLKVALSDGLGDPSGVDEAGVRWDVDETALMRCFPHARYLDQFDQLGIHPAAVVGVAQACFEEGWDPRRVLSEAEAHGEVVLGGALHAMMRADRIASIGSDHPSRANEEAGSWVSYKDVAMTLPGVAWKTLETKAFSAHRRGRRFFWVDGPLREELRNETIEEVLRAREMSSALDVCRRFKDVIRHFKVSVGLRITEMVLGTRVERGTIVGFSAAEAGPYGPRCRFVVVPDEVWHSEDQSEVLAWLNGRDAYEP